MENCTGKEIEEALRMVTSVISRCEKAQQKFVAGTSQHTLLKNRLMAMYISQSLLTAGKVTYAEAELTEALRPVSSVISKCEKAQQKYQKGTGQYTRFEKIIKAMELSKALITEEIRIAQTKE